MATLSLGRLCYSCLLGRAPEGAAASQHAKPSGALARILTRPSQSHTFLAVFMVMAALYNICCPVPKPKAQVSTMQSFPLVCDMRTLMKASRNSGKACIERMLISISPRHVLVLASRPLALALRRSCRGRRWHFRLRFAIPGIGTIAAGCQLQAPPQAMPHLPPLVACSLPEPPPVRIVFRSLHGHESM